MKLKLVITLILLLSVSSVCFGKEIGFKDGSEMKGFCETFLELMVEGKTNAAFRFIEEQWPFPKAELQTMALQTVKNLDVVRGRFGKPLSRQLVKEEEVKDVCLKYTYVVKHEKHLLRWTFIFYKPKERWILNVFKWDDSIEELFAK